MKHTESGDGGKEMAYDGSPSPGNIHRRLPFFVMDEPQTPEELEEVKEDLKRLVEEVTDTPSTDEDSDTMDTNSHTFDLDDIDDSAVPPYIVDLKEEIADLEFKLQTQILSAADERELTETIEEKREELAEFLGEMQRKTTKVPYQGEDSVGIDDISGGHIPRDVREDEQSADGAEVLDGAESATAGSLSASLSAYDTPREDSAHLCCSECGERIELVNSSDVFTVFSGGVCGCADPPGEWRAEELHTTSDRA